MKEGQRDGQFGGREKRNLPKEKRRKDESAKEGEKAAPGRT